MNNVLFLKSFFTKKVKGFPPCEDCPPPPCGGSPSPSPGPCNGGCCGSGGGGGGGGGGGAGPLGGGPGSSVFAELSQSQIENDIADFFGAPAGPWADLGTADGACGGCAGCGGGGGGGGGVVVNNNMGGEVRPVNSSNTSAIDWKIINITIPNNPCP